jgi:hypothetical protein
VGDTTAQQLTEFFQLQRMPRVPAESYYDILAQMVTQRTGNWATFGVGWNRTFQELARVRSRYTHGNKLYAFDWWEGLPEDWRPGYPRGFFRIPRERIVRWYEHDASVVFVDGLFQDTLDTKMARTMGELALLHIDSDLYSSARLVLDRVELQPGMIVMFDEFYSPAGEWAWHEHEARAFHEVCVERGLRPWPLCRRDVSTGPLSEQAAFLIQ